MKTTIKDIAKSLGISPMSVSYALRDVAGSPKTRKRVLRVAKELGYKPNVSARAMATGKFGCVSLLLSTFANRSNVPSGLMNGIQDELIECDLHLNIAKLPDEKLTDGGYVPKILRELMVDGLLINYTDHIPQQMLDLINQHGVPAIWINSKHQSDCIYPDDFDAGRRAAEYLMKLGHRQIAYVNYSGMAHYSGYDHMAGYQDVMRQAGLESRLFIFEGKGVKREDRPALAKGMLEAPDRPSAIITEGSTAVGPILLAAAAIGLQIPRDMSIVAFAPEFENTSGVAITTLLNPIYEMGQVAVGMLLKKIEIPNRLLPTRTLKYGFAEGQSCAPPS